MKKKSSKTKIKNKNTNRVNVVNTIKIGNTHQKKRPVYKSNSKSGVSSIVVSIPQSIPNYTQPFYPFHIQPPVFNLPATITNPTKIITDDLKRDSISANNQHTNSKPSFIKPIDDTVDLNTRPAAPPQVIPDAQMDSDDDNREPPLRNGPRVRVLKPRTFSAQINSMNQQELHSYATRMNIDIIDPTTNKQRNMTQLKAMIKSVKNL